MSQLFINYFDFFFAVAFYLIFFIVALLFKILGGPTPVGTFCKAHFYSVFFYILARVGLSLWKEGFKPSLWDGIIGLIAYFMLHYSIVINFIGLATRSVSSTLLVDLSQQGGRSNWRAIFSAYGGGRGFDFIKANRLENMIKYGLVHKVEDKYFPTAFGKTFFKITHSVLGLWGLTQLGNQKVADGS